METQPTIIPNLIWHPSSVKLMFKDGLRIKYGVTSALKTIVMQEV